MPDEKKMKRLIIWLIAVIFVSFSLAVILFISSGDNWFISALPCLDIVGYIPS